MLNEKLSLRNLDAHHKNLVAKLQIELRLLRRDGLHCDWELRSLVRLLIGPVAAPVLQANF